jgi:hypothetical protein
MLAAINDWKIHLNVQANTALLLLLVRLKMYKSIRYLVLIQREMLAFKFTIDPINKGKFGTSIHKM